MIISSIALREKLFQTQTPRDSVRKLLKVRLLLDNSILEIIN
jgi:hypothetical protein